MSMWSSNIDNKIFIVTGGAVGVGAAVVRDLLCENAQCVAFLDIKDREGSSLETELLHKFGALRAKFIKCDIGDEEQLAKAFHQVVDKYGRVDAVINNAAVLGADEEYHRMININFTATVNSTLKAINYMGEDKGGKGGAVVNVSSLLAFTLNNNFPVYAATKSAVLQFSNSIGSEECYSRTKVRVLTVCLGPTDTAILQRQNLENFNKDCGKSLTSRVPERQRVESAAHGILEAIKNGSTGSTWMVANNKPAVNISKEVKSGFHTLSKITVEF